MPGLDFWHFLMALAVIAAPLLLATALLGRGERKANLRTRPDRKR